MSYVKVTSEELRGVAGQLDSAAQAINAENARAMGQVNNLVGQGWDGAASGQFHALFQEWKTSADRMQQALHGISGLLNNAGALYQSTEDQIRSSMAQ
jgi:WXG100 family type VII secretion target